MHFMRMGSLTSSFLWDYLKNEMFYQQYLHAVQEMKIVICSENGYVSVAYVTSFFVLFCCVVVVSSWA
jgi:hypothetical protein